MLKRNRMCLMSLAGVIAMISLVTFGCHNGDDKNMDGSSSSAMPEKMDKDKADDKRMKNKMDGEMNDRVGERMDEPATIVAVLSDHNQFSTLDKAVREAQLTRVLQERGPYTLFAPTDDAFDDLPDGVLEKLLKPENRWYLQMILKYHVVKGQYDMAKIGQEHDLRSLEGQKLIIRTDGDQIYVSGARVTNTDLISRNGVVHQIDKVLLPDRFDVNDLR
ncbi:fasciclin domain-containing protein [Poriferisphaera sp. WC338]|uniref:fasciclin domain-containing protein n=1 Tax=Poriferisphaera sp. WC338 TaxID=3425129 RepID=UPI003D81A262